MIVYCDGVFDLFHSGHVNHFKRIKWDYKECTLIVGIMSDRDATGYKRPPIYSEEERCTLVESCKYVDRVIKNAPLYVSTEFLNNHSIDKVIHAFSSKQDYEKQKDFYKDKLETIPYQHNGPSTTSIIKKIITLYK